MDVGSIGEYEELDGEQESNEGFLIRSVEREDNEPPLETKPVRPQPRYTQKQSPVSDTGNVREIDRIKQSRMGRSSFLTPVLETPKKERAQRNSSLSESLLVEHKIKPKNRKACCACTLI